MNRKSPTRLNLLCSVSICALALLPIQAVAQESDDAATEETAPEEEARMRTITVTGTKRESDLQDVAQSISAFTEDDIDRQGLDNLEDYVKSLPSVTFYTTQPGRNEIIFRGIANNTEEWRTDSSVSVYLDEQPMTSISQQVDPRTVDIERIESLPGPQGTLFGSSSQSGTLRIITNKPDPTAFTADFDTAFSYLEEGEPSYDLSAVLNVPLIEDKLAIRAVGFTVQDGGYVDNVLGAFDSSGATNAGVVEEDFNDWGVDGGRISALWNVNENWKILATGLYEKSRTSGDWKSDPTLGEYKIVRFLDDQRDDEWWSTALTVTGDLGFAELTSASAYLEREIAYINDSSVYEQARSAYFAYGLYDTLTGLGADHRDFSRTFNDQNQQRFSQELRLTSKGEGRFQWMLGAFYEDVNDEWFFGVRTPRLLDTQSWQVANSYAYNYYAYYDGINFPLEETDVYWAQFYDRSVTQKAIFGEITYDLTDKLRVAAGGRWFEYERDRSETNQLPLGLPTFVSTGIDDNLGTDAVQSKDSDTVWKLGLQYDIDEDRMLYALYSEGFRLGGTNSLRVFNEGLAPREYEPDTLRNYEVGFKTTWFDDRVTLNASAFKMEWDQIQSSIFGGGFQWWQNGNVNAGTAETTGLEASAWAQVTDRLTLNGSVFVADAKYTEDFDQFVTRRKGEPLLFAPDSKFWLAAEYTIPDVAFGADLWFRYDYWRQSKSFQNAGDPPTIIPASESSDFQVGFWKDDDWNLTLTVNNVWDQRQIYSFDQSGEFYADFFGTNQYRSLINYNRPREFTVRLRKSFGK